MTPPPQSSEPQPGLSVFFPAYNDGGTIASMVVAAMTTARELTSDYEVIVVNDGSVDSTRNVLEELARLYPALRVIHHPQNRGYGAALRTGFASATKDLIFYTDGDAQYDPREMTLLWQHLAHDVDFVNGYKISRSDPLHRIVIGRVYHHFVKTLFGLRLRDVDCDFRLLRRRIFDHVSLEKSSGVICVEMMRKIQDAGFRLAEVPVHHHHRAYGKSQFFNFHRIALTLADLATLWYTLVWKHPASSTRPLVGSRAPRVVKLSHGPSRFTASTVSSTSTTRNPPRPDKRERITIPFLTLKPGEEGEATNAAIRRVLDRGWFVLGPEVETFEHEFAAASGVAHAVGVGNGTDALVLLLKALGIGPGDEVITTPLSAAFTALAIVMAGARPVFADIDANRLTIDPAAVRAAVGAKTAAILPVHLYGQPADMPALADIASRHNLALIEDCCQAHLATCAGRPVGTFGHGGAFSFYPTKNLGALGDGEAACTGDGQTAERIIRLRNGGQSAPNRHDLAGVNSRLDEIQAAVLRAKLPFLEQWTARRRALAALYREHLAGAEPTVPVEHDPGHVYHLFPIRSAARERFREHLLASGIETIIHYPTPLPRQPAFAEHQPAASPVADAICRELVSLPLHPALTNAAVNRVIAAVRAFTP